MAALAALSCVLAPPSFAAEHITATKKGSTSTFTVVSHGGTGVVQFQDIQVPVNDGANLRGDGTPVDEENQYHLGLPLYAGVAFGYKSGAWSGDALRFDALYARASTGPAATQSSSYARLEAASDLRYAVALGDYALYMGPRFTARRSSFNNISSGHYVSAFLLGGLVGLRSDDGTFYELTASVAPTATIGYSDAVFLGGKAFPKSSATMASYGARTAFPLREDVWLDLGLERETAHVSIEDVNAYNHFGLSVFDVERPSRTYDLVTTVARIGIRESF